MTNTRRREYPKLTLYNIPKASTILNFMCGKDKDRCVTYFSQ